MLGIAKLFPYRDPNGRLMFRGIINDDGISKFFPCKHNNKLRLRGKLTGGAILWGFPYREAATGNLMARTAVGEPCACPIPTDVDVTISGVSGYWWPFTPGELSSGPTNGYDPTLLGYTADGWFALYDDGVAVDLAGMNTTWNCVSICAPNCNAVFVSDWQKLGQATAPVQNWYDWVNSCPDTWPEPPEWWDFAQLSLIKYVWCRVYALLDL